MEKLETDQERTSARLRCINLDWLEVYVHESQVDYPHDAAFFMQRGWEVVVRPYGTRVYDEMFTLYGTDHEPLLEIRRKPAGAFEIGKKTILDPYSCHIRLHNRTCYFDDAAMKLQVFLLSYNYEFQRISRVDLALDFTRFDKGDNPSDFLQRYMQGRYSKLNQANLSAHGTDLWDGRYFNSVSWGSPKSMVSTKFYNKTMELKHVKDKPYIRQAWALAGLVDDFVCLTKRKADGSVYSPDVWRVEFSIRSSVKGWVQIEDCHGKRNRILSVRNTLSCYFSRPQLLDIFASLASHYFYFKHYEQNKRKDRCKTKVLFQFTEQNDFYRVEKPASARPVPTLLVALKRRLEAYLARSVDVELNRLVLQLLQLLDDKAAVSVAVEPWNRDEVELLRRLLAYRVNCKPQESVLESQRKVAEHLRIERALFNDE